MQLGVRGDQQRALAGEQARGLDRGDQVAIQLSQWRAPHRDGPARWPGPRERPPREVHQREQLVVPDVEIECGEGIRRDNERYGRGVADQVLDQRLIRPEAAHQLLRRRDVAGHERGVPRLRFADLEEQRRVGLLRPGQRFTCRVRRRPEEDRPAETGARRTASFQLPGECRDAASQILLARHQWAGNRVRTGRDAAARQKVKHLARAQVLACRKRRDDVPPRRLHERQLDVYVPLVRQKRRATLLDHQRTRHALEAGDRRAELVGRLR